MPSIDPWPVPTTDSRRAVRKWVSSFVNGDRLLDAIGPDLEQFRTLGRDILPALYEVLRDGNPIEQLAVAFLIAQCSLHESLSVDESQKAAAEEVLVSSLSSPDGDLQSLAGMLLSHGGVPNKAIPQLRRMVAGRDTLRKVAAAAALTSCGPVGSKEMAALATGLRSGNEAQIGCAAIALARVGVRQGEAISVLTQSLPRVSQNGLLLVLHALSQLGPLAKASSAALTGLVLSNDLWPSLRSKAARTLAHVNFGSPDAEPVLMKALQTPHWQVIEGVIEGLRIGGPVPLRALQPLIPLLSSENGDMRRTAARAVASFRSNAAFALNDLLARIIHESRMDVAMALAEAIAASGEIAIEPLVKYLQNGDVRTMPVVTQALSLMGPDAAAAVAGRLLAKTDPLLVQTALGIIISMGTSARVVAPHLVQMLTTSGDDEAYFIVVGLTTSGDDSVETVAALIRCLTDRKSEVSQQAAHALRRIGKSVVPQLQAELPGASAIGHTRIQSLLGDFNVGGMSQFKRCLDVGNDGLLMTFYEIGTVLLSLGAASYATITRIVAQKEARGDLRFSVLSNEASTLRSYVGGLEKILGFQLVTRESTKPTRLTDGGQFFLGEVEQYLHWRKSSD